MIRVLNRNIEIRIKVIMILLESRGDKIVPIHANSEQMYGVKKPYLL